MPNISGNDPCSRTAIIAGGSLAGLMAGAILARQGWRVRIFERVPGGIESRGTGIATHPLLFEAFRRAGALVDDSMGMPLIGRSAFARSGEELCHYAFPQMLSPWSILYRRLRDAVPSECYELGTDVVHVADSDDGVVFQFQDGREVRGALAIGADGIWSRIRSELNPAAVPAYSGYVAWRGLIDERELGTAFAERYAPLHSFFVDRNEQFILYAINGADDSLAVGRRRFGFLWYRAVDEASELPDLLTDVEGVQHEKSIPPPKIRQQHIQRLRELAAVLLPPQFAEVVQRTPQPFLQPIFDLKSDRVAFKRTVLMGDAAFVARPHVGAGVMKAAGDALALADALGNSGGVICEALHAYQQVRLTDGAALVDRARYLGGYLEGSKRRGAPAPVLPVDEVIRESGRG